MNILFAFKAEPDSGMLAEKDWLAATEDTRGPDTALLRCSLVPMSRRLRHYCWRNVVKVVI